MLSFWDSQKESYWIMHRASIAGSASFVVNGYSKAQVTALRDSLRAAAQHGFNWQDLYTRIYQEWHSRRSHFPTPEAMAVLMKHE